MSVSVVRRPGARRNSPCRVFSGGALGRSSLFI